MSSPRSRIVRDLMIAVVVTVLALAEAAQVYVGLTLQHAEVTWAEALRLTAPSWLVLFALIVPLVRVLDRWNRGALTGRRVAVWVFGACAFSGLHLAGSAILWQGLGVTSIGFATSFTRLVTVYFVPDVLTFVAVGTVHALVRRYREDRRRELDAAARRADDAQARFLALRGQLRPDFFFNTLNAVTALMARGDAHGSVEILSALGALLRASLTEEPGRAVSLEDELELVGAYLSIQLVRFPDRLVGEWDTDPDASRCPVPQLFLVQLVEAVVDEGIASGQRSVLGIQTLLRSDLLEVSIHTTRPPTDGKTAERFRARLLAFSPAASLSVHRTGITLLLPARPWSGRRTRMGLEVAS